MVSTGRNPLGALARLAAEAQRMAEAGIEDSLDG
jgi:hypothetical protein